MHKINERPVVISNRRPVSKSALLSATNLLGWRIGISTDRFHDLTHFEAASKVDLLGVAYIVGSSTQQVSREIRKNLDYRLNSDEINKFKERLAALHLSMPVYNADSVSNGEGCEQSPRRLFEFAKDLGVEVIVCSPEPGSLPILDQLANEFEINVALQNSRDPRSTMSDLEGTSRRIGISANINDWIQRRIDPLQMLSIVQDRLMVLDPGDVPNLTEVLLELSRQQPPPDVPETLPQCGNCRSPIPEGWPLFIVLNPAAGSDAFRGFMRSASRLDEAIRPAMGYRMNEISRNVPISPTNRVPAAHRKKIEAALPRQAFAKPQQPRRLLILDLSPAGGFYHETTAHGNLALELMSQYTGAYQPVFSNDLNNLKYDNTRRFDAVFLNNTVGDLFIDPAVIDGLIRFVREGGGLAGLHGASYASMMVPEFGELLGAQDGPHRVETATLRIEDPQNPINASFEGIEHFEYREEYFRFFEDGPYSREKIRVLLSIDVGKTDMRGSQPLYLRQDNDYAVSWIKSYGKGRVFYSSLGHTPDLFMTPKLAEHILAGVQFVLGDLEANTSPGLAAQ